MFILYICDSAWHFQPYGGIWLDIYIVQQINVHIICDSAWHFQPYGGIWSKFSFF